ncbi:MAG: hypothetical protein V3V15_03640 [Sphingorhabdus sp.]
MRLIEHLETTAASHESYVQKQLAKEDLSRIIKLRDLARQHEDLKTLKKHALFIGWTKGDMRTHELSDPLNALIEAVHDFETKGTGEQHDAAIMDVWMQFHKLRMKILIHCL